jgi:hypothetical protein
MNHSQTLDATANCSNEPVAGSACWLSRKMLGLSAPAQGRRVAEPARRENRRIFGGKAKAVIWIFVNGGASQVDTWNYRPELEKLDGKSLEGLRQQDRLLSRGSRRTDEVAVRLEAIRRVRRVGFGPFFRIWPSTSTRCPSCIRATRRRTITAPRSS